MSSNTRPLAFIFSTAFALRAWFVLTIDVAWWPDEIMGYWEMAHNGVFGYGIEHWETAYTIRPSPLIWYLAAVMTTSALLGADDPALYFPAAELGLAALSATIPVSIYVWAERHAGERAARYGAFMAATWYEFAVWGGTAMTEPLATAALAAVMALGATARPLPLGAAAALGAALRPQYGPALLAAATLGCVGLRPRGWLLAAAGAAAAATVVGLGDALWWGPPPFRSYIEYVRFALQSQKAGSAQMHIPAIEYAVWLFRATGGLVFVGLACALALPVARRRPELWLPAALILAVHLAAAHKEPRYLHALTLTWIIGIALAVAACNRTATNSSGETLANAILAACFLLTSLAGLHGQLPGPDDARMSLHRNTGVSPLGNENTYPTWSRDYLRAFAAVRRDPDLTGLAVPGDVYQTAPGYAYLHRPIPYYDHNALVWAVLHENRHLTDLASHLIVYAGSPPHTAYTPVGLYGTLRVDRRRPEINTRVAPWRHYRPYAQDRHHEPVAEAATGRAAPRGPRITWANPTR